eukprot:7273122-Alexandrium_andersonii.AAC.1
MQGPVCAGDRSRPPMPSPRPRRTPGSARKQANIAARAHLAVIAAAAHVRVYRDASLGVAQGGTSTHR